MSVSDAGVGSSEVPVGVELVAIGLDQYNSMFAFSGSDQIHPCRIQTMIVGLIVPRSAVVSKLSTSAIDSIVG